MKRVNERDRSLTTVLWVLLSALLLACAAVPNSAHAQTFKVLYSFDGTHGANPDSGVIGNSVTGSLYGTTFSGGIPGGVGTVYKLSAGGEVVLHSFVNNPTDGKNPKGPLVQDPSGNLYGTTLLGGESGTGTVFEVDTTGHETVLHSFGDDDGYPYAGLILDSAGNLYGTTQGNIVFKLDASRNFTVLYNFCSLTNCADGNVPDGGLTLDSAGNLYGTTYYGGAHIGGTCGDAGCGTIYKLDPAGTETVLYSFMGGTDGQNPLGTLARDTNGNLYGTTVIGGDKTCNPDEIGCGVVFVLDATGKETVLHRFHGGNDSGYPYAGVVLHGGNLFGTAAGNTGIYGTVFMIDRKGRETVLHSFSGGSDGANPNGQLMVDKNGNLYGTTYGGGHPAGGIVFKLTP